MKEETLNSIARSLTEEFCQEWEKSIEDTIIPNIHNLLLEFQPNFQIPYIGYYALLCDYINSCDVYIAKEIGKMIHHVVNHIGDTVIIFRAAQLLKSSFSSFSNVDERDIIDFLHHAVMRLAIPIYIFKPELGSGLDINGIVADVSLTDRLFLGSKGVMDRVKQRIEKFYVQKIQSFELKNEIQKRMLELLLLVIEENQ